MQQQQSATTTSQQVPPAASGDSVPVVPLRHPVRNALAIVLILIAASAALNVATNERYH